MRGTMLFRALTCGSCPLARLLVDGEFPRPAGDRRRQRSPIRWRALRRHPRRGGFAGITINAIPVISDDPIGTYDGRTSYSGIIGGVENAIAFYRRDVIGGPGAFVVEARTYDVFGEALKRRLLRELIASY